MTKHGCTKQHHFLCRWIQRSTMPNTIPAASDSECHLLQHTYNRHDLYHCSEIILQLNAEEFNPFLPAVCLCLHHSLQRSLLPKNLSNKAIPNSTNCLLRSTVTSDNLFDVPDHPGLCSIVSHLNLLSSKIKANDHGSLSTIDSCDSDSMIQTQLTLSPPIRLRLYTLPYWSNPPFLIFEIWALLC